MQDTTKPTQTPPKLRVLVVGATRGTGRAAVQQLLDEGHRVTAFSRSALELDIESERLSLLSGRMKVSRSSVARFLAQAATSPTYVHRSVAVSGAEAAR